MSEKIEFEANVREGGGAIPIGIITNKQLLPFAGRRVLVSIKVLEK